MTRLSATIIAVLMLAVNIGAQNRRKSTVSRPDKEDTILASILPNLSTPSICGDPAWSEEEFYTGTIVKRQFDDSEIQLSGIVLKDRRDRRVFINIDTEHVSGLASSANEALSSFLTVGRRVRVDVYRCRKVLFARRIKSL